MKRIALFFAIAFAAISCMQEEIVTPEINVVTAEEELVLSSAEGIIPVAFNVNVNWKAEIKEPEAREWCAISPLKGGAPGDNVLNVICIENKGTDNRTATVVIKAMDKTQELVVTQLQKDVLVITANDEYDIPYQGQDLTFKVAHNLDLKVTPNVDWITRVDTKALVEDSLVFAVAPNTGEAREGKITFKADPFEEVIVVRQAPWVLEFTLDPSEDKVFDPAGGEYKISVDANVDYTVTLEDNDWLTMTRGEDEYTFKAVANDNLKARSVDLRIAPKSAKYIQAAKTIRFSQKGAGAELTASETVKKVTYPAQAFDLTVKANIEYAVAIKKSVDGEYVDVPADEKWLTYTVAGDTYTFNALENASWEERSLVVCITPIDEAYADMTLVIPVHQYGYAFMMWSNRITSIEGYDPANKLKLAMYNEKLLLANTTKIFVLNPMTGEVENTINMPDGVMAHSVLVDDAGHLLIASDVPGIDGEKNGIPFDLSLYYVADPANPSLEEVLNYHSTFYCVDAGNFRVKGNIKEDAVVTATLSEGAGGAALMWEIVDGAVGECVMTNVPYIGSSVSCACTVPLGTTIAEGLYYIAYGGDRNLMYAADPVALVKDEDGNYINATEWVTAYETKSDSNYNHNCISTTEWNGNSYAALLRGCHFTYCNVNIMLLNINDPSSAKLLYAHDGEFDVERDSEWVNQWWTGGGPFSDVLLIPVEEAILVVGADSNYGTITCLALME